METVRGVFAALGYEEITPDLAALAAAREPVSPWPASRVARLFRQKLGTRAHEVLLELFDSDPKEGMRAMELLQAASLRLSFWASIGPLPSERWVPLARAILERPDWRLGEGLLDHLPKTADGRAARLVLLGDVVHSSHAREALSFLSHEQREALAERFPDLMSDALTNPKVTPAFLERAFARPDAARFVSHVRDSALLMKLAGDDREDVRRAVAMHHLTPPEVRHRLSKSLELPQPALDMVLQSAAAASKDPAELAELAREAAGKVRVAVASNALTTTDVLEALACDADGFVREAVARHPSVPRAVWSKLAVDAVKQVRRAAAENPVHLARSESAADAGTSTLSPEIEEMIADPITRTRRELLRRKGLPDAALKALADDPDPKVRRMVATSANATSEILGWLAADEEAAVRAVVATKRRTPLASLRVLADDDHLEVAKAATATLAKMPKGKEVAS